MRLRNKPGSESFLSTLKYVVFEPRKLKRKWHKEFKNKNPLYVEVGMGKGKFLEEHFTQNQNINYIGVEKEKSVIVIPAKRFQKYEQNNFRLIVNNAFTIDNWFKRKSITNFFINFPDPWPKKKHHKRRLMHKTFLDMYSKLLVKNGTIEFKSDQKILYDFFLEGLENNSKFKILEKSENLHKDKSAITTTEYETRFINMGHPIYFIKIVKTS